jgi:hypothetical protein
MLAVALVAQLNQDTWKDKLVKQYPKAHAPPDLLVSAVKTVQHEGLSALLNGLLVRAGIH